jgi:hypothetical protein
MNKYYRLKFQIFFIIYCFLCQAVNANIIESSHPLAKHIPNYSLLGQGTFKKFGFEIYKAQLYVENLPLSDKFALNLLYSRSIRKEALLKATIEQLEHLGYPLSKTEQWKAQLDKIYPNINKGDQLTAIFQPNNGTIFLLDDQLIGKISGTEFAEAFFGIWLSPKTSAPELRSSLLTNNCPPKIIQSTICQ